MKSYYAPDPYQSITGFWPLDSLLSGVASVPNAIGGSVSSAAILPAKARPKPDQISILSEIKDEKVHIEKHLVITHDNAELDTIEVADASTLNQDPKNKIYIIKFNGNGEQYEDEINRCVKDAKSLNCTIVAFNYRGVGYSTGNPNSKTTLVTDGIAEVQRVLDQGVSPKHIILDGLSLGGGIATLVAKHFYDKDKTVNLFNDRSFSSISSTATNLIASELPNYLQQSLECASYSCLKATDWEMNAAAAYKKLPDHAKGYMFVAKKSTEHPDYDGDGVIPPAASLHAGVKKSSGQGSQHWKMIARNTLFGGHNAHRNQIVSADDPKLTGQDIFENFVRRVTK